MAVEEAALALSAVAGSAEDAVPLLEGNARNLGKALDVSRVFKTYASRLRSRTSAESALTNSQGDLLRDISKRAEKALIALNHLNENASLALDRAYSNGEEIEKSLCLLVEILNSACSADQLSSTFIAGPSKKSVQAVKHEDLSTSDEAYRPAFNAPVLHVQVRLDFSSRDADGTFAAPEGALKCLVAKSTSSSDVTAASGARSSVHAVSGMAGVGKTIALVGLGHDVDLKEYFCDGILFMSLGAQATEEKIAGQLDVIMRATGATSSAAKVKDSSLLVDAVPTAAIWFRGKRILFLLDDVWSRADSPEGYLPVLQGILCHSPESRIAISTRSLNIAVKSGSHVDFGARDPQGPVSMAMFMSYATGAPTFSLDDDESQNVRGILNLCAGLPIALAVTGHTVACRVASGLPFVLACRSYLDELSEEMHLGVPAFEAAIDLSLRALEEKFQKKGTCLHYSVSDMYASFCVFRSQQFAPVAVLARMWNITTNLAMKICDGLASMSLTKMSSKSLICGTLECGMLIHDLHLDYCRQMAERKQETAKWHSRLLDGHLSLPGVIPTPVTASTVHHLPAIDVFNCLPRSWWKDTDNTEYISGHMCRHLRSAGLDAELGATVLNIRWMNTQVHSGGMLALRNDFQQCFADNNLADAHDSMKYVLRVLEENVSAVQQGLRMICFILLSHLFDASKTNKFLERFLSYVKEGTPRPFLEPVICRFLPPGHDLIRTIAFRCTDDKSPVISAAFSNCKQYVVALMKDCVSVLRVDTAEMLKRRAELSDVGHVKFNPDGSKVIFCTGNTICVWNWSSRDSPRDFCGHTESVTALAFGGDTSKLFSGCYDGTVNEWDLETGEICKSISFKSSVWSLVVSSDSSLLAVGTSDEYLRFCDWQSGEETVLSPKICAEILAFSPDGRFLVSGGGCEFSSWRTDTGEKVASAKLRGFVLRIAFDTSGRQVFLASFLGQVYRWAIAGGSVFELHDKRYGEVTGMCSTANANEIMVAYNDGWVRIWNASMKMVYSKPRPDKTWSFSLSADGTRAVELTNRSNVFLRDTSTGAQIAKYYAPTGCRSVALGSDGRTSAVNYFPIVKKIIGEATIRVGTAENPPQDTDLSFEVGHNPVRDIAFSPDGKSLLVVQEHGAFLWKVKSGKDILHKGAIRCGSFSRDGTLHILRYKGKAEIWNSATKQIIFDSSSSKTQEMTLEEAKNVIHSCGPKAHSLWPFLFSDRHMHDNSTQLDIGNIRTFLPEDKRWGRPQYCHDVLVLEFYKRLAIFRLSSD